MVQLRYLSILSDEPDGLAAFYQHRLGLEQLGRSPQGDVSLTDGFYNITFFRIRPELGEARVERGLHHVGLQVESMDETLKCYRTYNPRGVVSEEAGQYAQGEVRIFDPEGNPMSLSEGTFGVAEEVARFPRMVHIALNAYLPQTTLEFYVEVLGFREVGQSYAWRNMGKKNRFAGDGHTNLAIHPFHVDEPGHEARYGVNHIGFLTNTLEAQLASLSEIVNVAKRPDNRPYAEYRLRDPDCNMFDLSQRKGWEVDIEKWDLVA
jgi:catechol 2,3-dioxygenase-like lactoylglutathione lyase family enzyme